MRKRVYVYAVFSLLLSVGVYFTQKFNFKLPKIIQFYLNDFFNNAYCINNQFSCFKVE